jgi:hypothetical protein
VTGREIAVREERGHATGGQAAELDERLSDVGARSTNDAGVTAGEVAEGRTGRAGDLEADEGAQGAVGGLRASVGLDTTTSAEADGILGAGQGSPYR